MEEMPYGLLKELFEPYPRRIEEMPYGLLGELFEPYPIYTEIPPPYYPPTFELPPKNVRMILHIRWDYDAKGKQGYHHLYIEGLAIIIRRTKQECDDYQRTAIEELKVHLTREFEMEADVLADVLSVIIYDKKTKMFIVGATYEDTDEPESEHYEYTGWGR